MQLWPKNLLQEQLQQELTWGASFPALMIACFLNIYTLPTQAIQVSLVAGVNQHTSMEACCVSGGTRPGVGFIGELSGFFQNDFHVSGFSTGTWNEVNGLIPFYWIGSPTRKVVPLVPGESVKNVSQWRVSSSVGLGYFSHTTKTKDFLVPILISGVLITNVNTLRYSLGEDWSLLMNAQFSFGLHRSGSSMSNNFAAGFGYEF